MQLENNSGIVPIKIIIVMAFISALSASGGYALAITRGNTQHFLLLTIIVLIVFFIAKYLKILIKWYKGISEELKRN